MDSWNVYGEEPSLGGGFEDLLLRYGEPESLEDAQNVLFNFEAGLMSDGAPEVEDREEESTEDGLFLLTPPTLHDDLGQQGELLSRSSPGID